MNKIEQLKTEILHLKILMNTNYGNGRSHSYKYVYNKRDKLKLELKNEHIRTLRENKLKRILAKTHNA